MTQYAVWVLDESYNRTALLANTGNVRTWKSLTYRMALDDVGSCQIEMVANSDKIPYLQPMHRIHIYRNSALVWGGMIQNPSWKIAQTAPAGDSYTVAAQDHAMWAKWRRVIPPSGSDQDRRAGPADDVAKAFVRGHMGLDAALARRCIDVTVEVDRGECARVVEEARYDVLLTLLQALAKKGGGFHWRFTATATGAEFRTAVLWGLDRRKNNGAGNAECVFSLDRKRVTGVQYTLDLMGHANHVYVAGQGEGVNRQVVEAADAAAIAAYGRREEFADARQLSLTSSLLERGAQALADYAPVEEMTITPRVGTWKAAWDLGDLVTLYANRYNITCSVDALVQAVEVTVGADGVERATPELTAVAVGVGS